MSQLLTRILKPHVCKNVIRHNNKMVRLFTSMQMIYPYVLIDYVHKIGKELRISVADSIDSRIEIGIGTNTVKDIVISKELRLPYLPTGTQIQNVAIASCQRDEDTNIEDLVVAVKLSGSQIKVYRPASHDHDFRWIDIQTIHESISPFSSLMYSKKDQKFYIPTPGGEYLCSFDLNVKEMDKPELIRLRTNPLPLSLFYNLSELIHMTRTDHLVESPSGEQFLIKWYYGDHLMHYINKRFEHKTERFMVFKVEGPSTDKKGKMMSYTEDIGDLCILLGRNEAFCLQASSSLGLQPNCIYFVGYNYGVFDITTQNCILFTTEEGLLRSTDFPCWPHPIPTNPT